MILMRKKIPPSHPVAFFKEKLINNTNVGKFCTCSYILKICL